MGEGVGEAKAKSGPPVRSIAVSRICGNQGQVWKTADSSIGRAPHWHCGGRGLESNSVRQFRSVFSESGVNDAARPVPSSLSDGAPTVNVFWNDCELGTLHRYHPGSTDENACPNRPVGTHV